ncbi:MAG TPA: hypothetical protein VIF62_37285, partial [Labilithrix sp.]
MALLGAASAGACSSPASTTGDGPLPTPPDGTSSSGSTGTDPGSSGASGSGSSGASGSSGGTCAAVTDPLTGTVTATGGSLSRLVFAVVGDTRPANEDDSGGYPSAIISKIYQDIEAQSPHPPF